MATRQQQKIRDIVKGILKMRQMKIIAACACILIWLAGGCAQPERQTLPSFIAGTWQERNSVWRMAIEPDGTVSLVNHPFIPGDFRPHKTTRQEMKDGKFSTYTGGDFTAGYDPNTRELSVFIETRKLHLEIMGSQINGKTQDRFIGPVSEDGKVWRCGWYNIFDYGPQFPPET